MKAYRIGGKLYAAKNAPSSPSRKNPSDKAIGYAFLGVASVAAVGVVAYAFTLPKQATALGATINGQSSAVTVNCGAAPSLKAVGGTPNGVATFVASSTPNTSGIVAWTVCPNCFVGQFDGNGNFSASSVFVNDENPLTFYVTVKDVTTGGYGNWIAVTVLPVC
jgi:hypothetical protein